MQQKQVWGSKVVPGVSGHEANKALVMFEDGLQDSYAHTFVGKF